MSMSQYWNSGRSRYLNFDKVVIKLQYAHLDVLQNETSHVYGQGVRDGSFVHLSLVRIVDDDFEVSEPSIVDHERCRLLRAVFHVTVSVHVSLVPQQLHGVRDDGLVRVLVSLVPGRGHNIAKPPEARYGLVLDDLVDVRHLEAGVQVPSQQGRGEHNLISSITTHEHAPRRGHDVLFFDVSAHERSEIVARQTDVLVYGLHLGKVLAQCFQHANVNSIIPNTVLVRTPLRNCCDVIVHRTSRRRGNASSRHVFTAGSLLISFHPQSHTTTTLTM